MTPNEKRFLTYDEQIAGLRRQGMTVGDEAFARKMLAQIGYYELVNGYKAIFKPDRRGKYLPGTTFEELLALYKLDENLRQLCFKYILRIEIHMRSLLSYAFSKRCGSGQQAYLTRENYDTDGPDAKEINRLIGELDYAANRSDKAVYVRHHRERYGNVPLWVLFKTLSVGTLLRFFRCCKPEIRAEVAAQFPDLREGTLGRMLDLMQDFRNVCAHNDCLYAYRSPDAIPMMPAVRRTAHPGLQDRSAYSGCDMFALLVVFRYLLDDDDYARCTDAIRMIVAHFDRQSPTVRAGVLLRAMGFPRDWDQMTL
ncbi:MAG: Abi family protein [Clostridia bacterium]|nr:Abi family protein [Clostridia bacterium]